MITAQPHLRRRVLKRKNARFQCRLYKHSFSWTLLRFPGTVRSSDSDLCLKGREREATY